LTLRGFKLKERGLRYSFPVWTHAANCFATPWPRLPIAPPEPWKTRRKPLPDLRAPAANPRWQNSQPLPWPEEEKRFFASLGAFDDLLASADPLHAPIERLFQGPVADALTHVGQLAMLRRLAGCPTRGENFYVAAIATGQVSADQPAPVKPF